MSCDGHGHTHDLYGEDGAHPTVVSLTREIPRGAASALGLAARAERIVYTLASVFAAKKILIGHIKLQALAGESACLFISATSRNNITKKAEGGFGKPEAECDAGYEHYDFGLTLIVFGMPEGCAASLAAGIVDGLLDSPA
jgi:hypothetical protein